jgi:hexosaminidase
MTETIAAHFAAAEGDVQAATSGGARLLVSPVSHLYFDRPLTEESLDEEQNSRRKRLGLPVYPSLALSEVATRDPLDVLPGLDVATHVAGIEAAVWCETVEDATDLEILLMPRLAGLAEVAWGTASRTWDDHASALAAQAPAWRERGWAYFQADTVDWGSA